MPNKVGKILGNAPCPSCRERGRDRTGNHLILFQDGGAYCNRCGYTEPAGTGTAPVVSSSNDSLGSVGLEETVSKIRSNSGIMPLSSRGIKMFVAEHYGYRTSVSTADGVTPVQYYLPYYDTEGTLLGYKLKTPDKRIWAVGNIKGAAFFGSSSCPRRGNKIFITEGEEDAMALYQVLYEYSEERFRGRIAVVSLSRGVGGAAAEMTINEELLRGYKEIVLCFDMDEPGREGVNKALTVLPREKVRVARYVLKDACDMLVAGKGRDLYYDVIQALPPRPDKVIDGMDISLDDLKKPIPEGISSQFPGLDTKLGGWRHGPGAGELTIITAASGFGKTTLARALDYHFNKHHKLRIGHIFLEEGTTKTAQGLIALDNRIPLGTYRRNPGLISDEALERSVSELIHNGRTFFLRHWGSLDSTVLVDYLNYFSVTCKCDFVFLDHISLVVSGQQSSSEGERKDIDILMTRLSAFVEETGTSVIAIVHLSRPDKGSYNEGKRISLRSMRGSAAIEQLAHNVISVEGDQSGEDPNYRLVRVLKCREFGSIGEAETLRYDNETGWLDVVAPKTQSLFNVGSYP